MTRDLGILALKAVLAGSFVVLLSLLAEMLRPKMFAGLFAGAPAVASVSLVISALVKPAAAVENATGMIAGAVAMVACCTVATVALPRSGAWLGSLLAWLAWALVAVGIYLLFLA